MTLRGYAAFAVLILTVMAAALIWAASQMHPLGKCVPGAHPAITLERCASVQP